MVSSQEVVYRVGIIGCGRIAGFIQDDVKGAPGFMFFPYGHIQAYRCVPSTKVVAVAELDESKLQAFAKRWEIKKTYTDYKLMLEKENLDIVSICTPSKTHCKIALDVANCNVKGIFCEKPIALNLDDADKMIRAFHENNVKVALNHTRTYSPYHRRARELIKRGEIGDLHSVVMNFKEWILFGGTHFFDVVRYLIDSEPEWVFGSLDDREQTHEDVNGSAVIGFKNGIKVFVNASKGNSVKAELDIIGTEGRIRISNDTLEFFKVNAKSRYREMVRHPFPAQSDGKSGMVRAIEELIQSIETGKKTSSNEIDGRVDLEIAIAIHLSSEQRRIIEFPVKDTGYFIDAM